MWEFSSPDFFFLFINNLKLSKMKKKSMFVKNIRLVPDNTEQIEGKIEGQTIVILTKYLRKQG
jgi:uncharacterized Zn ribbon protein